MSSVQFHPVWLEYFSCIFVDYFKICIKLCNTLLCKCQGLA